MGVKESVKVGSSYGFFFFSIWFLLSVTPLLVYSRTLSGDPDPDPCDAMKQREFEKLRSDQITVLINGYSESRIPLLQSIVAAYSGSSIVSSILLLWGNPTTPAQVLDQLYHNLTRHSLGTASISLIQQSSSSLNARFLPRASGVDTRAVLICDDDVEVDKKSLEFAFSVWRSNPDRLVGMFVRSHGFDLQGKEWIYTVHPDKYSILLTKFMMMKQDYLFEYSCNGGVEMEEMRKIVDRMRNCEDILMNFVAADKLRAGPIMVGAERVRDWGDARNEEQEQEEVREVGLSSRRVEHRKRRGNCIREFHRVMGKMPLMYSYGKVVNSVGEQGLCRKSGKLVFCDRD